ncbi:MAG: Spo0E family sporulation regulatory protein-aspartic acid phosphatase [Clostridia bacterium]
MDGDLKIIVLFILYRKAQMMKEIIEQKKKIEELRRILNDLINKKGNLLDSEIIKVSQLLDEHLVEYYRLLKGKKEQEDDL